MIFIFVITFLLCVYKKYKVRYLFTSWTIYPFLIVQAVYLGFQIAIFMRVYSVVPLANLLKLLSMVTLLVPFFVYKLYSTGLIASVFVFAGTFMNRFVMAQNGGKMPVFPSLSYKTGYTAAEVFNVPGSIHVLGTADTKYKFLADIFDFGYSVLSIGDFFIHIYFLLILYQTVKVINQRRSPANV